MKRMVDEKEVVKDIEAVEGGIKVLQLDGTSKTIPVSGGGKPTVSDFTAGPGIVIDEDLTHETVSIEVDQESIPFKVDLSTVAFSGDYDDLFNKPVIPSALTPGDDITITNNEIETIYGGSKTYYEGIDLTNTQMPWVAASNQYKCSVNDSTISQETLTSELATLRNGLTMVGVGATLSGLTIYASEDGIYWEECSATGKVGSTGTAPRIDNIVCENLGISNGKFQMRNSSANKDEYFETNVGQVYYKGEGNPMVYLKVRVFIPSGYKYGTINYNYMPIDNNTITIQSNKMKVNTANLGLASVATSGSYNDLSNTPTIPDAVSGTNDGTNWTSLTIGSDTYGIGGSAPSNMVTTDTTQTITGDKTFGGRAGGTTIVIGAYSNDKTIIAGQYGLQLGHTDPAYAVGLTRDGASYGLDILVNGARNDSGAGLLVQKSTDNTSVAVKPRVANSTANYLGASNAKWQNVFFDLPTSDPQVAGQLWNDNGTIKVSNGQ